jgi:hypothetical protein
MRSFRIAARTTCVANAISALAPLVALARGAWHPAIIAITEPTSAAWWPASVARTTSLATIAALSTVASLRALSATARRTTPRTVVTRESARLALSVSTASLAIATASFPVTAAPFAIPTALASWATEATSTATRIAEPAAKLSSRSTAFTVATTTFARTRRRPIVDAHREGASFDRGAVQLLDDGRGIGSVHFGDRVGIADLDLAHVRPWNSGLAGNRANEIACTDTVTLADAHEEPSEPVLSARCRTLAFGGTTLRAFRRALHGTLRFHTLRGGIFTALALDHSNRSSRDLESIEFGEQRLERDDFPGREPCLKLVADRGAKPLIARARLRGDLRDIERLDRASR